jgi:hypothetical protein
VNIFVIIHFCNVITTDRTMSDDPPPYEANTPPVAHLKMLRVNGAGVIVVARNIITSEHEFEVEETETVVDVFCPGDVSIIGGSMSRGSIIGSSIIASSISWGGGSMNVLGHGSSISNGGRYSIVNHGHTTIGNVGCIVNGQINMGGGAGKSDAPSDKERVKRFVGDCTAFDDVDVKGAARVECVDPVHLVGITIQGSGDVVIRHDGGPYANSIHATVLGSGDISFHGMVMTGGVFTVTGSGDIHGAHCTSAVTATVTGSGDISCTVERDARVRKRVVGSGDITVSKTSR